jgi:hypothetical protein
MDIYKSEDRLGNLTKTIFSIKIIKKYSKVTSENMLFKFNSDLNVGTLKSTYYTFLLMARVVRKDYKVTSKVLKDFTNPSVTDILCHRNIKINVFLKNEFKADHEFLITDETLIALLRNEKLHNVGVEQLKYFLLSIDEI